MEKPAHSDIAAFPALFDDADLFIKEIWTEIRNISLKLGLWLIAGSTVVLGIHWG